MYLHSKTHRPLQKCTKYKHDTQHDSFALADGKAGFPVEDADGKQVVQIPQWKELCWSQIRTEGKYCSKEKLLYSYIQSCHLDTLKILHCNCLQNYGTTKAIGLPDVDKKEDM